MGELSIVKAVSVNCKCSMQKALNLLHKTSGYICPDCREKTLVDYSNDEGCFCILCDWASQ